MTLTISKPTPNRLDIDLSGSLDAEAMTAALDDLIELSQGITRGRMLYRIEDFALPSLGALAVEVTYLPKLFDLLPKFDKCAVVTEAGWLRTASEVEGALFPGIDIKAFRPGEIAAAEAWLQPRSSTGR